MGHTGYRDHINNVMCACALHARSTDDLSSPEWDHVAGGRAGLAAYVHNLRSEAGFWLPPLLDA
jgi:tellurite resistance protein